MKTKDELKNDIVASAEFWARKHAALLGLVDLLPNSLVTKARISKGHGPDEIIISLPYSLKALCEARKELGRGWKRDRVWGSASEEFTYKCFAYHHPEFPGVEVRFDLNFDLKNGSTCQLNLVGQKTVPVYEVVCN